MVFSPPVTPPNRSSRFTTLTPLYFLIPSILSAICNYLGVVVSRKIMVVKPLAWLIVWQRHGIQKRKWLNPELFSLLPIWRCFLDIFLFIELTVRHHLCYNNGKVKAIKYVTWGRTQPHSCACPEPLHLENWISKITLGQWECPGHSRKALHRKGFGCKGYKRRKGLFISS